MKSKPFIFPYRTYRKFHSPIIPVEVQGNKRKCIIAAYVDSGAWFSVFCVREAVRLGIDYKKGKPVAITIGERRSIKVYVFRLPIKIGSKKFKAAIAFSEHLGINLLGRKDVFRKFDITFRDAKRTVSFVPTH